MTFSLFDSESNPTPEWTEDYTLALVDGYYSVSLGSTVGNAITDLHLDHPELWLGLSSISLGTLGRSAIGAVPYARNGGGSHTTVAKTTVTLSRFGGHIVRAMNEVSHGKKTQNIHPRIQRRSGQ
ncbi:MAG: hypothetical protein ACJAV2_004005, partial [Myxococcota bacterium]